MNPFLHSDDVLEARPDYRHYWKVARVRDGVAVMAGLDESHAKWWARDHNEKREQRLKSSV